MGDIFSHNRSGCRICRSQLRTCDKLCHGFLAKPPLHTLSFTDIRTYNFSLVSLYTCGQSERNQLGNRFDIFRGDHSFKNGTYNIYIFIFDTPWSGQCRKRGCSTTDRRKPRKLYRKEVKAWTDFIFR